MGKLEKAYLKLSQIESAASEFPPAVEAGCQLSVAIIYLCFMLSVPLERLSMLIWFALIPIISAAWMGISFGKIFRQSLIVLPFVALIGIFNPILNHAPSLKIGSVIISEGWVTFISIIVRGILAVQICLIMVQSCGFIGLCRAMNSRGIPSFLTDQLQFIYRYLTILLQEAITMKRARESRGFGKSSFPLRLWATMTGELFLRAVERSERIHRAMLARGFTGVLPKGGLEDKNGGRWNWGYFIVAGGLSMAMRFVDFSSIFNIYSL